MTSESALSALEYGALCDSLAHAGAVVTLAELHGGICGALGAGSTSAAQRWLEDCLKDQELSMPDEIETALQDLINVSWRMLEEGDLGFEPLLPDDDAPLEEQVQALAFWCHGFLGALGTSAPDVGNRSAPPSSAPPEASQVMEIIADFTEISRAGLSEAELAGEDQPDFALAEIKEYVRVSAQIVFEDLAPRRAAAREVH